MFEHARSDSSDLCEMYPLGWGKSHPGLHYWVTYTGCKGCVLVTTSNAPQTSNSIRRILALLLFFQGLPEQGIKHGICQPEQAVHPEDFANRNSSRSADDLPQFLKLRKGDLHRAMIRKLVPPYRKVLVRSCQPSLLSAYRMKQEN